MKNAKTVLERSLEDSIRLYILKEFTELILEWMNALNVGAVVSIMGLNADEKLKMLITKLLDDSHHSHCMRN